MKNAQEINAQQEVVERVAEVLFQTDSDRPLGIWDELSKDICVLYLEQAKAALSALPQQRVWTREELVGIIAKKQHASEWEIDGTKLNKAWKELAEFEREYWIASAGVAIDALITANAVKVES